VVVTNDEMTGREDYCARCGERIEEALLLKGLMVRKSKDPDVPKEPSPGIPRWRRVDRGPGSARCTHTADGVHVPLSDL
jgi:hypothetical protein